MIRSALWDLFVCAALVFFAAMEQNRLVSFIDAFLAGSTLTIALDKLRSRKKGEVA